MLSIRPCVDADLEALERAFPNGGHEHHAHHAYRTYLVAWDEDRPVGIAVILWDGPFHPDVRAALPDAVEISNVHVRDDHRGRGIGTGLLMACLNAMRAEGYAYAIIGQVGPAEFYAKTVGASVIEGSETGTARRGLRSTDRQP